MKAQYESKVIYVDLADCVHHHINNAKIELVVMGTHGVSGIKELLSC